MRATVVLYAVWCPAFCTPHTKHLLYHPHIPIPTHTHTPKHTIPPPPQDFHARYYHPSNARFWFYGDDAPEERLRLLAAYLDEFEARPVDSTVHTQPLFSVGVM